MSQITVHNTSAPIYFLDTETTGLSSGDRIVELAIVNSLGETVMNSLINPGIPIPFYATNVHGINDSDVAEAPFLEELWETIEVILGNSTVVIYNAAFDRKFFPDNLACASEVCCAMLEFSSYYQSKFGGRKRRFKLADACEILGLDTPSTAHRAVDDALACRNVWGAIHGRLNNRSLVSTASVDRSKKQISISAKINQIKPMPSLPSFAKPTYTLPTSQNRRSSIDGAQRTTNNLEIEKDQDLNDTTSKRVKHFFFLLLTLPITLPILLLAYALERFPVVLAFFLLLYIFS